MKAQRLILITCIIVLSFAGVGYSAWSQDLSIISLFHTGNIKVVFQDPVVVNDGILEICANADEGVLDISGEAEPDSTVLIEYDIYNDSSIPVKYDSGDVSLPEGITLNQSDQVIEPGEYLRDNQLIIEPGKNELILPFVQFNSTNKGGWKEELKICWNITILEDTADPALDIITEPPETETTPETESTSDPDPIKTEPEIITPEETLIVETPSDPVIIENSNESTSESETLTETSDENVPENNAESEKGSEENVTDGAK